MEKIERGIANKMLKVNSKSKKRVASILALTALFLFYAAAFADDNSSVPDRVSIINLIATPERFHGRNVFLSAYVSIEFENMSLCMTDQPISNRDCVWLAIGSHPIVSDADLDRWQERKAAWSQVNHEVVSIIGTFDKDNTGHMSGWSGSIKNVTRVYGKDVFIDFTTAPPTVRENGAGAPQ